MGVSELKKVEEKFKLGIRVYEPSEAGIWRLIRQPAHYEAVGVEPMTIGWFGDHAFLIKKIKNVKSCYPTAGSSDVLTAGNFSVPSCSCNGHIITFHVDGQQTSNTNISFRRYDEFFHKLIVKHANCHLFRNHRTRSDVRRKRGEHTQYNDSTEKSIGLQRPHGKRLPGRDKLLSE